MKFFNKENGVEKMYVQLDDLLTLYKTEQYIPISVFDKFFLGKITINEYNKFDFIEFYDKDEIEFFKAIDWIVDGKQLNKKNAEELNNTYNKSIESIKDFLKNHNGTTLSDDDKYEYELLTYKSNSIWNFFMAKYGNLKMRFPEAADSKGLIVDDSATTGVLISKSLNPNSIVMTKASGKPFTGNEPINNQLITQTLEKMRLKRKGKDDNLFEYETSYDMSKDSRAFIIKYRKGKYKANKEEQGIVNESNKLKKILKKILK